MGIAGLRLLGHPPFEGFIVVSDKLQVDANTDFAHKNLL